MSNPMEIRTDVDIVSRHVINDMWTEGKDVDLSEARSGQHGSISYVHDFDKDIKVGQWTTHKDQLVRLSTVRNPGRQVQTEKKPTIHTWITSPKEISWEMSIMAWGTRPYQFLRLRRDQSPNRSEQRARQIEKPTCLG